MTATPMERTVTSNGLHKQFNGGLLCKRDHIDYQILQAREFLPYFHTVNYLCHYKVHRHLRSKLPSLF